MAEIKLEKGGKLTLPPKCVKTLGDQPLRISSCSKHHLLLVYQGVYFLQQCLLPLI